MEVLESARAYRGDPPVVSIGNFDGVHRGHVAILRRARREADRLGAPVLVLSFHPHPARVVRPERAPGQLTTPRQKRALLAAQGVDTLLLHPFDSAVAALEPEEFATRILARALRCRLVVVGDGFRFGRDRRGGLADLTRLGRSLGFEVAGIAPVSLPDGTVISSSRVRDAVGSGSMERAAEMLGRPFALEGVCVEGEGRGRGLGFPTANLGTDGEVLPARGVYLTECALEDEPAARSSVTNVGVRPTFGGGGGVGVETHILDFDGDLLGRAMEVRFLRRLRDERRFAGPEDLAAQIRSDVQAARAWFGSGSPSGGLRRDSP